MDFTEGDQLNPKKRKGSEHSTESGSEGEEQAKGQDPVLVSDLLQETREGNARAAASAEQALIAAQNVNLLVRALGLPEEQS